MFFFKQRKAASVTELGLLAGLIAVLIIGAISTSGTQLSNLFSITGNNLNNVISGNIQTPRPTEPEVIYKSCKELHADPESPMSGDGIYEITPTGSDTIEVYCKGPLTLVTAQFEADQLLDWNEGIQGDYDPSLASAKSFALNSAQIPTHTKTYFGTNLNHKFCLDGFNYTTGNIAATIVNGCDPSNKYWVYRNSSFHHFDHNPDNGTNSSTSFTDNNTLAIEFHTRANSRVTESNFTWAYSPKATQPNRGYSYDGQYLPGSNESYAWTVWVE